MPKKIYSIALVMALCASFALAVQSPTEWVKVDSADGRFSAAMPSEPVKGVRDVDTAVGKLQLHTFGSSNDTGQYMLSYADYPNEPTAARQEAVLDGVRGGVLQGLKAELVTETKVTLKGHPGREFRAVKTVEGKEVVFSWKMFLVGRRLYQMGVATTKADSQSPDIQKFFTSFQLTN